MNVGIGNEAEAVSFLGKFCFQFSVQCLCSANSIAPDSMDIEKDPRCNIRPTWNTVHPANRREKMKLNDFLENGTLRNFAICRIVNYT
jgi:hypothetical protein